MRQYKRINPAPHSSRRAILVSIEATYKNLSKYHAHLAVSRVSRLKEAMCTHLMSFILTDVYFSFSASSKSVKRVVRSQAGCRSMNAGQVKGLLLIDWSAISSV